MGGKRGPHHHHQSYLPFVPEAHMAEEESYEWYSFLRTSGIYF